MVALIVGFRCLDMSALLLVVTKTNAERLAGPRTSIFPVGEEAAANAAGRYTPHGFVYVLRSGAGQEGSGVCR